MKLQHALPGATSLVVTLVLATSVVAAKPNADAAASPAFDSSIVSGLGARNIGSATMSGRISALAARQEKDGKVTIYVGSASGGVWKSQDGGTTFKPVFDKQPVQSIGAVALDPSDTDTIWVGTGESWTRNSVSIGNGVYRSRDGGESWDYLGLPESERINKILVHPKDSNTVYVCVPGKLWSDSPDRGLYKTSDGGKTWSLILKGPNLSTGCSGLTMDPRNPDRLFTGLWDFRRKGWSFRSGGDGPNAPSGSGLFLTDDGGRTWQRLDDKSAKGLPPPPWGRLDVEIAPSKPDTVYAVIEGTRSALFRSDDGGKTWDERDRSQSMVWRPFYFSNIVIDPTNAERLFKMNFSLIVSEDGGKSFSQAGGGLGGTHGDHHDTWINPTNPKHVITGDDGGLFTSYDGGNKWQKNENLPISQFYHVSLDDKDPYKVFGGLQDNSCWMGDSAYPGGITNGRWESLNCGDGFWVFEDPADPGYAYTESQGGYIGRINLVTHEQRSIQPQAGLGEKLRYNWNTPVHLSPNVKGKIYIGAQFLFASADHGQSWQRISPDLTTNDPQKQKQEESGGITVDNSAAEMHTTIYSIAESPRSGSEIWVGTDDGNLQLTRDGGKTWTNVAKNVKGLPPASWVSTVEPGHFADGVAYATFDRHTFGDMNPWVYRTEDFGKSWQRIAGAEQGVRGYAHVIKEDPVNASVLYLGTEFGLWISIDRGATWAAFKGGNFPSVAVRDIAIQPRDGDVVLATHGRGIWIVDDVTPLRALTPDVLAREVSFLPGRPVQQRIRGRWRLGRGRRTLLRHQSAGRRDHQLLPEDAARVRPDEARDLRQRRPARRHAAGVEAQGREPGRVVDADQAATGADGGAGRVLGNLRSARAAGHLHRAIDQGRPGARAEAGRRSRSPRDFLHGGSQVAVRRGDAGACGLRAHDRPARPAERAEGPRRGARRGTAGWRSRQGAGAKAGRRHRRAAQGDRRDEGGRGDHRRGAAARAPGPGVWRAAVLRGPSGRLPGGARRRARPRVTGGRETRQCARRRRPAEVQRRVEGQRARDHFVAWRRTRGGPPGRPEIARTGPAARGRRDGPAGARLSLAGLVTVRKNR